MKPNPFLTEPLPRYEDIPSLPALSYHTTPLDLSLAQRARGLNFTLQQHKPPLLPASWRGADEQAQAVLCAENCIRRVNWRRPDDVLRESDFVTAVTDLLEALYRITATDLTQDELRLWWERDFLVPGYRYTGDSPLALGGMLVFSESGLLEDVQHEVPLDVYRQAGHVIDHVQPEENPRRNGTTLYTWGQVRQALEIYRHSHPVVNILRMSPKRYTAWHTLYTRGLNRALQRPKDARVLQPGRPKAIEVKKSQRKEAIVADCKKWQPICKGLNDDFKSLGKLDQYQTKEAYRKEQKGKLAKKYKISIADVEAIECYLGGPPPISKKNTPTKAMCRMVARFHPVRETTVERIWNQYTREYPEWRRKKRKTSTTPTVGRTA